MFVQRRGPRAALVRTLLLLLLRLALTPPRPPLIPLFLPLCAAPSPTHHHTLTFCRFESALAEVGARLYHAPGQDPYSMDDSDKQWALGFLLKEHVLPLFRSHYGHAESEEHEFAGDGPAGRSGASAVSEAGSVSWEHTGVPSYTRSRVGRNVLSASGVLPAAASTCGSAVPLLVDHHAPIATTKHDERLLLSVASPTGQGLAIGSMDKSQGLFGRSPSFRRGGSSAGWAGGSTARGDTVFDSYEDREQL